LKLGNDSPQAFNLDLLVIDNALQLVDNAMSRQRFLCLRQEVVCEEVELLHELLLYASVHAILVRQVFDELVHVLTYAEKLLKGGYVPIEFELLLG
jgi:hypothetical protein